jgi:C4-dicarboxylate-binding protein DctP
MSLRASLLALALGFAAFTAQAADPIVIKFSHVVAPDTPKGRAADYISRSWPRNGPRAP